MKENNTMIAEENSGKLVDEGRLTAELLICVKDKEMIAMPMDKDLMIGSGTGEEFYHIDSRYLGMLHGKFIKTLKGYKYIDLGTKYGTYLNSREVRMKPVDPVKLADGDVLRVQGDSGTDTEDVVTFVFRKRYVPYEKWKSLDMNSTSNRIYISRYEEKGGVVFSLHGSVKKVSDFTLSKWDQQALMIEAGSKGGAGYRCLAEVIAFFGCFYRNQCNKSGVYR